MRSKLFLIPGGLASLTGPAGAQNCSTQYPPDPLANMSEAGSCNSLPPDVPSQAQRYAPLSAWLVKKA